MLPTTFLELQISDLTSVLGIRRSDDRRIRRYLDKHNVKGGPLFISRMYLFLFAYEGKGIKFVPPLSIPVQNWSCQ